MTPPPTTQSLTDAINRLLPQWQCQRCEYAGCAEYAEAIVKGEAVNRCPPGGEKVLHDLQDAAKRLLGRTAAGAGADASAKALAINPTLQPAGDKQVAQINPDACIGCTRCLPACPLGAIVGGKRSMHVVLTDLCTGCALCVPVCPMDCIAFIPDAPWQDKDPRQKVYFAATARMQQVQTHPDLWRAPNNIPNATPPAPTTEKTDWLKTQMQLAMNKAQSLQRP